MAKRGDNGEIRGNCGVTVAHSTARTAALRLLTCRACGASYAVPKGAGRYPATCSDDCKATRGKRGDLRVSATASTGTGVLGLGDWSARHGGVSEAAAVLFGTFGGDDIDAAAAAHGWHVTAGYYPAYDAEGRLLRDSDGRAVMKFRNWSAEAADVPAVDSRVIGQVDLPHDWQDRLGAGETLDALVMPSWLGLPVPVLAGQVAD